ncbi:MAG TPA: amidohydrolase family protein [Phenylobacterium sp.]|uniref:amidohydrolase family protein n=1 Tax=Phenylobacterium sp. TaxID=1871053 RepID=UPI002D6B4160|nr:amidohydrolase family protein [Phenylobacterium sp.]HZZ67681.1 amidohydrolase family protein [Phenylobacterium sp.]
MKKLALLAACAMAVALPRAALAEAWAIEHVTLIDGTGHAPQADMTVTVDGDRITGVTPSALTKSPKGHVIDAHGKYLMPGLMDVHIHLHGGVDEATDTVESRTQALAGFLYSGVTTVYDAGNQTDIILPLRAAERAGKIASPRIFCTGNLITYPGSHGSGMAVTVQDFEKDKAKLDKQIAEQQPDVIKLTLEEEGWGARPMIPLMPEQLLRDVIRYYNLHGIRTTIHVSSELRAEEAIFAGTDSLAHPVIQGPVSDSFVKLMGAKKIPFASTLTIGDNYSRLAEHPEFLDQPLYAATFSAADRQTLKTKVRAQYQARMWTAWMKLMTPVAEENVRKVHDAGGVVAMGTDQSSGPASQRELELLVASGIKPFDVLTIATHNGAVLLGKADKLGSVEPGKLADLLLLNADPTASIENVKKIAFVMKGGQIIDESTLPLAGGPQKRRFTP